MEHQSFSWRAWISELWYDGQHFGCSDLYNSSNCIHFGSILRFLSLYLDSHQFSSIDCSPAFDLVPTACKCPLLPFETLRSQQAQLGSFQLIYWKLRFVIRGFRASKRRGELLRISPRFSRLQTQFRSKFTVWSLYSANYSHSLEYRGYIAAIISMQW